MCSVCNINVLCQSHTCLNPHLHYLWLFLEVAADVLYLSYNFVACTTKLSAFLVQVLCAKKFYVQPCILLGRSENYWRWNFGGHFFVCGYDHHPSEKMEITWFLAVVTTTNRLHSVCLWVTNMWRAGALFPNEVFECLVPHHRQLFVSCELS